MVFLRKSTYPRRLDYLASGFTSNEIHATIRLLFTIAHLADRLSVSRSVSICDMNTDRRTDRQATEHSRDRFFGFQAPSLSDGQMKPGHICICVSRYDWFGSQLEQSRSGSLSEVTSSLLRRDPRFGAPEPSWLPVLKLRIF